LNTYLRAIIYRFKPVPELNPLRTAREWGQALKRSSLCAATKNLPEPDFEQRQGFFVLTLWRDWLTTTVIAQLGLNARQRQAVLIAKTSERLSNLDYQKAFAVSKPTASRDLEDMLRKGILEKIGTTGKGTYYVLNRKGLTKGSKGS
jgi:ATP-dependent DNA helicase RecG